MRAATAILLVAALGMSGAAWALDKGEVAPDFTAQDTDGHTLTLSERVKDRTVVVAFFPKAFTPG